MSRLPHYMTALAFLLTFQLPSMYEHAHAERATARIRSVKHALLKRKAAQEKRGEHSTVKIRSTAAHRLQRSHLIVTGRKKGDIISHPRLGRLVVSQGWGPIARKSEVIIVETTVKADGSPDKRIVISEKVSRFGDAYTRPSKKAK